MLTVDVDRWRSIAYSSFQRGSGCESQRLIARSGAEARRPGGASPDALGSERRRPYATAETTATGAASRAGPPAVGALKARRSPWERYRSRWRRSRQRPRWAQARAVA